MGTYIVVSGWTAGDLTDVIAGVDLMDLDTYFRVNDPDLDDLLNTNQVYQTSGRVIKIAGSVLIIRWHLSMNRVPVKWWMYLALIQSREMWKTTQLI
jgi:hypothetical protein